MSATDRKVAEASYWSRSSEQNWVRTGGGHDVTGRSLIMTEPAFQRYNAIAIQGFSQDRLSPPPGAQATALLLSKACLPSAVFE